MQPSVRYAKAVEWSENDQCYVGSAPGIIHGACHGDDAVAVFAELCVIVEEWIEIFTQNGDPLPSPSLGLRERIENERETGHKLPAA